MGGACPNGEVPPECYAGPKWAPNDPLFFLHHTVRGLPAVFSPTHVCYVDDRQDLVRLAEQEP